ncbi:hypothetical protein BUALT_Bualt02G0034300 [Buddleja alternifolia]|uniref:Uncharacterized protein n=1 Tax=Buddleja alternifolia TaxID=168488 RepID=A0AAV6Y536_9LAMI|nr:hypothetical protein BUALT_Bualt02G0034300 [Buddleja alternifolia]
MFNGSDTAMQIFRWNIRIQTRSRTDYIHKWGALVEGYEFSSTKIPSCYLGLGLQFFWLLFAVKQFTESDFFPLIAILRFTKSSIFLHFQIGNQCGTLKSWRLLNSFTNLCLKNDAGTNLVILLIIFLECWIQAAEMIKVIDHLRLKQLLLSSLLTPASDKITKSRPKLVITIDKPGNADLQPGNADLQHTNLRIMKTQKHRGISFSHCK